MSKMMAKLIIVFILLFTNITYANASIFKEEILYDYFDDDNIKDQLKYQCYYTDLEGGPYCKTNIKTTNKDYSFSIYFIFSPSIDNCGTGCIVISDFDKHGNIIDTDEFRYKKDLDNWILIKNYQEDNKIIGIDGKEYNSSVIK